VRSPVIRPLSNASWSVTVPACADGPAAASPHYARGMTDTEDLVQEAMMGTFRNFQAFGSDGEWALQACVVKKAAMRAESIGTPRWC
jgi:hypothetical protein